MWIGASKPSPISEEQIVVHSGILYWMAVHADIHTMREGCTFVIDTSKQKGIPKVGNEKKLQNNLKELPLPLLILFCCASSNRENLTGILEILLGEQLDRTQWQPPLPCQTYQDHVFWHQRRFVL